MRRIPFGLRDKVNEKLEELLKLDIIEKVTDGPTMWVSPLVVVPKANGDIRCPWNSLRTRVTFVDIC